MRAARAGILLLAALVVGTTHLEAQQGPPRGGRALAAPSIDELKTALNLTPDQNDKVGKIIAKWETETKVARETAGWPHGLISLRAIGAVDRHPAVQLEA